MINREDLIVGEFYIYEYPDDDTIDLDFRDTSFIFEIINSEFNKQGVLLYTCKIIHDNDVSGYCYELGSTCILSFSGDKDLERLTKI